LTAQLERYLLVVKIEPELLVLLGDEEGVYASMSPQRGIVVGGWGLLI
jgi:hypothetical protein